ncbi:putative lipid II flippase FtsW [Geobacter sp. SVR]|uniref:putative lipid II flippase FtsW n=1 Tax=Geobacter sp. SVR TaxID=2495594 RepID=UPI00143F0451|nr:putative lipid II flippase FtsW [Geobacter sp. SVR]BCS52294.1 putative lipid II flippase FtsW [Geobacter sp. SVR]GCF85047.1 putative lipid II flippase FtsW [Geobacter sp. SVR]
MKLMLKKLEEYDLIIMLMAIALTCFGVVMVYSASNIMADKRFHDGFFFLKRQGLFALVGFTIMLIVMRVDYHLWKKLAVPALLICLVLLGMVLIPGIGGKAGGSSRWIKLPGFNLQPSEMAKLALIMYMAYSLDKKQDKVKSLTSGFIPYMIVLMFLIVFLVLQPDLGGALTLAAVAVTMLFAAGTRLTYILSMFLLALPLLAIKLSRGYHKGRIDAYLDPWSDPAGKGFQIIQSWLALGTGGVFGQGLGEGKQKLFYLPEAHTDFILSVVGEELGFLGVAVIIGMFFLLVQRSMRIAVAAPDTFGRFLALGIAVLFGIEATVNMGVVTGLLPTKGLALPFISYGGSSLLISLFAVGILLNISSGLKISPIGIKDVK